MAIPPRRCVAGSWLGAAADRAAPAPRHGLEVEPPGVRSGGRRSPAHRVTRRCRRGRRWTTCSPTPSGGGHPRSGPRPGPRAPAAGVSVRAADRNFYRAAQLGLDAELGWPLVPARRPRRWARALLLSLLPRAELGLIAAGVARSEIRYRPLASSNGACRAA